MAQRQSSKKCPHLRESCSTPLQHGQENDSAIPPHGQIDLTGEGRLLRNALGRQVVHSKVDQEAKNPDLDEIEKFLRFDAGIGLLLVQENGHREEHAVRVIEEAN